MASKRLIAALAIAGGMAATVAYADMPTIDLTSIKELIKDGNTQLQSLQTQIQSLAVVQAMKDGVTDIKTAEGVAGTITLPTTSIESLESQLAANLACLMPTGTWGINLANLNLGSICSTSAQYKTALFANAPSTTGTTTPASYITQAAARRVITQRRQSLLADTVVRALAQSDVQLKQAQVANDAASDLQTALNTAITEQDRLHIIAEASVLQARIMAARNEMAAESLKLQAATVIGTLPDDSTDTTTSTTSTTSTTTGTTGATSTSGTSTGTTSTTTGTTTSGGTGQ